ncbi:ABC transporter ATP-binding protein [Azospirillum picis]|uniref:Spermidine/putrescine transport system ATP-binding protein n=1 Tax=Azospirillum picis TaxID=488438 RepID=A0ABU0MPD1_9PROT|nr:ABC transporter ATP-binding protein [Azospirillum picis]MBP2301819.1 putative spermidine/putrescine transport system ATP-binding protein [Azospirillum picis]MDQ0535006.1 putative spermidine/putrescine transport system ATP-binding protein [Azospirillum picis]
MTYLVLDQLTKRFANWTAVDRVSLTVEKGELISLLGPSGCGKTTTLQMIAGFLDADGGRVTLDGQDLLAKKPNERGLGIVFQSYALFPHMTAAENVAFGLEMRRINRADRDRMVADALRLVGLDQYGDRHPRRMSGGQQQRVALARALVIKPSLLLLDEPLSNLDAKMREEMQIELRRIQRTVGTTMILVTHDQSEAMALSDRVVVMNKGRIQQVATPQDAYDRPANAFVANFLGRTNLLPGMVAGGPAGTTITVADSVWPVAEPVAPGPGALAVRPEKIGFVDAGGLRGTVQARVFQGTQWLFEIETAAGRLMVIRQHDGSPLPAEQERVMVGWRPQDMAVMPADPEAAGASREAA